MQAEQERTRSDLWVTIAWPLFLKRISKTTQSLQHLNYICHEKWNKGNNKLSSSDDRLKQR